VSDSDDGTGDSEGVLVPSFAKVKLRRTTDIPKSGTDYFGNVTSHAKDDSNIKKSFADGAGFISSTLSGSRATSAAAKGVAPKDYESHIKHIRTASLEKIAETENSTPGSKKRKPSMKPPSSPSISTDERLGGSMYSTPLSPRKPNVSPPPPPINPPTTSSSKFLQNLTTQSSEKLSTVNSLLQKVSRICAFYLTIFILS
jgi:hypothetical protein